MAESGSGRGPAEEDEEGYEQGSGVPPPPTYDDALAMHMDTPPVPKGSSHPTRIPPLSQIDKYATSWLFPLMMRVKTTLQSVRKQLKAMEEDSGTLKNEIRDLDNTCYLAMLTLTRTGMSGMTSHVEGDMLSEEVEELFNTPFFKDRKDTPRNQRYLRTRVDLWKNLRTIRSWLQNELTQDRDWSKNTPRVPSIDNFKVVEMKLSMMKVDSDLTSMNGFRGSEATIVDYATDQLLKMDMECLWSLLVRMGEHELGIDDDDGGADAVEEREDEEDVPEGDADQLRQKRLEFYNKGRPQRVGSQEDEEEGQKMLDHPKEVDLPGKRKSPSVGGAASRGNDDDDDDGDEEAKDSIATGGMGSVLNTEAERLRKRRLELYRQDSKRNGKSGDENAEEVEMVSMGRVASADDIELEMNSLARSGSPDSYGAAVGRNQWLDVDDGRYSPKHSAISGSEPEPGANVQQFEIEEPDAEAGRRRERRRSEYDVGGLPIPFLREVVNFVVRRVQHTKDRWPDWSVAKRLILVFSVLFVVGLVLLVTLLPSSFVYIDYHEMGFVYNRVTCKTDIDRVYDFGCHLLAPQHSMVLFPATAHFLDLKLLVMNKAGLTIGLDVYMQYLLRPNELPQLYRRYNRDYEKIISNMAESTVKNMAIEFTLDEYRLNRSMVEASLFHRLKRVLSGDCCNVDNDRYARFQQSSHHDSADNNQTTPAVVACNDDSKTCDPGYHIDLAFFQLGDIAIPDQVMEHYLQQIVLKLETEKEIHVQEKKVVEKVTSLNVLKIRNQAEEVKSKASAEKVRIEMVSKASRLKMLEQEYARSLKKTYALLNITNEGEKTSLLFLNTLKNVRDNLVAFTYNYDRESVFSP